jgi:hypothetical protein
MSQPQTKLEKVKLWFEIFALAVGIFVGIGGSIVGLIAWNESRSANRLNVDTQQGTEEAQLYGFLLKDPSLSGLFADFSDETNVLTVAHQKIYLLISTNNEEYLKLCSKQTDPMPWKTVQDLNGYLWNSVGSNSGKDNGFYDDKRVRLRKAYYVVEWMYDQIEYSFDANRKGQLSDDDFQGWVGYLDELCTHPLFLAALQDEHDNDYPSKQYCVFVQKRILAQPEGHELLSNIYSNMLDPVWTNSIERANLH